ncbi:MULTISPECIES: hypothetical protein [unclassified Blastococcus]
MPGHLRRTARGAALGAALLVAAAGCSAAGSGPGDAAGSTAAPAVGDGGALDTVAASLAVRELGGVTIAQDAAVGPDGEPVLLFAVDADEDGPLAVVRPTATSGWGQVVLDASDGPIWGSGLDVAPDGTVVVAGYGGDAVAVSRIAPDGTVSTVPVAYDLRPDRGSVTSTALSPDGAVLYLAAHRVGEDAVRLLAVDVATGRVSAERVVPSTGRSWNHAEAIAVSADGTVLVGLDTQSVPDGPQTAELARFTAALEPAGAVPLLPGAPAYDIRELAVAPDGAAVLAVHEGAISDAAGVLALVLVGPGATTAVRVATVSEEPAVDVLAVDPAAGHAYLGGLRQPGGVDAVTVTPVDLATGAVGVAVPLCDGWSVDALVVAAPEGPAHAAATCDVDVSETTLVTLV